MQYLLEFPSYQVVAGLLVLMFLANEIGYRLGLGKSSKESDNSKTVSSALKASILSFVAFLLAFSFSITTSRHDARREVVLNEANAIGTCYLRAGLLEEPYKTETRKVLREMTDVRIQYFQEGEDLAAAKKSNEELNGLTNDLWAQVEAAFAANTSRVHSSQIIPAANEVIDLNTTREWAVHSRLQPAVLVLLIVSILVSNLLMGHSSGQVEGRHCGLWISFNVLLALVLFVVLDYDRPRRGFIQVDHSPMMQLRDSIREE